MNNEQPNLERFWQKLQTSNVLFFPIRHHSPACAWHLHQLILTERPAAVLIEGPADATSLIPFILNPKTQAPFALYTSYRPDASSDLPPAATTLPGPQRFASYFPFCDYSPELVALRTGATIGAKLRFIDLTYPEQILAAAPNPDADEVAPGKRCQPNLRLQALLEEDYLRRSTYLKALAKKTGCRDQNDLWDCLFEVNFASLDTTTFIRNVATYCYFARRDTNPDTLAADGTLVREQAMAAAIRAEQKTTSGQILVVTGGLHTVALPDLLHPKTDAQTSPNGPPQSSPNSQALNSKHCSSPSSQKTTRKLLRAKTIDPETAQTVLIRYSFEQLDALNGYAAGMPTPDYYQRLWIQYSETDKTAQPAEAITTPTDGDATCPIPSSNFPDPVSLPDCLQTLSRDLLVEIGALTREDNMLPALSVADEIAAFEQTCRLAALRQHPGPTREDLLDAIRSCFIKGDRASEGQWLMEAVQLLLRGDRIGDLPDEVGVLPIVGDFRQQAMKQRLKIATSTPKKLTLDLYRKEAHRQSSRFLHRLAFLEVPFGRCISGPDFVRGTGLNRIQEIWDYCWKPQTESALVDCSLYGTTVAEAALYRLQETIASLADAGKGRSALTAVELLTAACRMGLHRYSDAIMDAIATHATTDPDFPALTQALTQLTALWQAREPLAARQLSQIPTLTALTYQRACYLLPNLASSPTETTPPILNSLCVLWEQLNSTPDDTLDPDLFLDGLLSLLANPQGNPTILGGAAGVLYNAGCLPKDELVPLTAGYLDSAPIDPENGVGFLRGLLRTCRQAAWHLPELLQALNSHLETWDEDEFLCVLPDLRLAFADLIPRETDKVAALVAALHDREDLGNLLHRQHTEADLQLGLRLNQLVEDALEQDGLQTWFEDNKV